MGQHCCGEREEDANGLYEREIFRNSIRKDHQDMIKKFASAQDSQNGSVGKQSKNSSKYGKKVKRGK